MLIGRAAAPVSGDIDVVHGDIVEYPISLAELLPDLLASNPDLVLRLYDTVGLEHRPSTWSSIMAHLKRNGGVDLVLYCMRRRRLSNEQVTHLREIWKMYFREGVPLLLVVNSVEFQRGSTEEWWQENGEDITNMVGVEFATARILRIHVTRRWNHQDTRYEDTQRLVHDLMIRHGTGQPSG